MGSALRFEVAVAGAEALPAVDLEGEQIVIGSGSEANLRLPLPARPAHVIVKRSADGWQAIANHPFQIGDRTATPPSFWPLVLPAKLVIADVAITISASDDGATPASPQRTASLARELVRAMV